MIGSSPAFNLSEVGKANYLHSEEEKQIIRDTVRCTNEALRCLDIEKRAIILREKALKVDLERYRIALAPIKQLPCDILYHIFELHCQHELPVNLPFRSKPPQITLSQVCLAWRRAILDFPKLWSNIVISLGWNVPLGKVVETANAWLSRAKDLPCSVEFKFAQNDTDWSEYQAVWRQDWHQNIVKNFVSRHKFRKLGVTFADQHLRDFLQLPDEKLSCIEDLCLRHVNFDNDNSKLDFHKLVNLTSFSLLPNPFIPIPHAAYIPKFSDVMWHQLQHIQLRVDVPALFCLTVMEHSSATLETCSLVVSNSGSSVPPFSYREPIHCSRLRDFTVDVVSSDAVKVLDHFLLLLRLPNLRSLTLGSRDHFATRIDPQTLIMMQNISSMRLEELVVSDTAFDIDVQVLLTRFPSLRRLELPKKLTFTLATMYELGNGSIGVNLEDLKIKDTELDIVSLLQMVKTRCSNKEDNTGRAKPTSFKSVVLHCDNQEGTVQVEIDQLIEEINQLGVSLVVNFPDLSDEESGWEYSDQYSGPEDMGVGSESDVDIETFGFYTNYY